MLTVFTVNKHLNNKGICRHFLENPEKKKTKQNKKNGKRKDVGTMRSECRDL